MFYLKITSFIKKRFKQSKSLKSVLILPFLIQLVGIVTLIQYISFKNSERAIDDISSQLLLEINLRVEDTLKLYLSHPHLINKLTAEAITLNQLDIEDPEELHKFLWYKIQHFPLASFTYWGDRSRDFYGVRRFYEDDLGFAISNKSNNYIDHVYKPREDGTKGELILTSPKPYDPRIRPWYIEASKKKKPTWSPLYVDFSTDIRAITASYPIYDKNGELKGVLGTDLLFDQFTSFLNNLEIGKSGQVLLMNQSGIIVATSTKDENYFQVNSDSLETFKITNSNNNLTKAAGEFLLEKYNNDLSKVQSRQKLKLDLNGNHYLQIAPFNDRYGLDWLIVIIVPESDFMERINENTHTTILISGIAVIVAIGIGIFTAQWITKPIVSVINSAKSLAKGNWNQKIQLKRSDEVGELSKSFNVMASQLEKSFAELESKNKELKRLDRLKNEFLANTSHELKTPLNGIINIGKSLQKGIAGELPQVAHQNLNLMIYSAERLSHLVRDILDFSQLKHKDIELQLKPIAIKEITEIILYSSQTSIGEKNLKIINSISPNLPAALADENRLQQILYNLVDNAIKFTETGKIEITAIADENQIAISVSDTGIGINPDKLESIFESFEQADGSIARSYGGTGLGLAITKKLIELHGGKISVNSLVGSGSTFTFTLPLSPEQPKLTKSNNSLLSSNLPIENYKNSEPDRNNDDYMYHLMIVDDDPINRKVLHNLLSLQNYKITSAASGIEALEKLNSVPAPDLILLDVMMPKMTGLEVTQRIRTKWSIDELPILLVSAKNSINDRVAGFQVEANDYVTKPFDSDELLARIKTHLNLKQTQSDLKENEKRLSDFLEAMPIGVFVTDSIGKPYYINKAGQEILGKGIIDSARLDRLSEIYNAYITNTDDLYPTTKLPLTKALNGDVNNQVQDLEIRRKDERRKELKIPVEVSATPIYNQKGNITGAIAVFKDITERKEIELKKAKFTQELEEQVTLRTAKLKDALLELQKAQKQIIAEQNLKNLGKSVAGICHEVNNPIHIASSLSESCISISEKIISQINSLDLDPKKTQKTHKKLERLSKGLETITIHTKRASTILKTMLYQVDPKYDDTLLSLGDTDVTPETTVKEIVDFNEFLDSIFKVIFHSKKAELKINFYEETNYDSNIPPLKISSVEYSRIFTNVINNACDAALDSAMNQTIDTPLVSISTELLNEKIKIGISDNGTGIPPQIIEQLFEPFKTTKAEGKGAGLGLYITQKLVEKNQGEIWWTRDAGLTTFWIQLPIN